MADVSTIHFVNKSTHENLKNGRIVNNESGTDKSELIHPSQK
jgi:hypothetical protein